MATLDISLSDSLKDFVEAQAARQGFGTVSEYLGAILLEIQGRDAERARIDSLILEGLESGPATPMTAEDWEDIRREGTRLIAERSSATG